MIQTGYARWIADVARAIIRVEQTGDIAKRTGNWQDAAVHGNARIRLHRLRIGLTADGKPMTPPPDWDLEAAYQAVRAEKEAELNASSFVFNVQIVNGSVV